MADQQNRKKQSPGRAPEEGRDPYVAPRDDLGDSDEVVNTGKQYYASENVPRWPGADANRQYIATPDEKQEIQHGIVTWIDAGNSDKTVNEDLDREHRHRHKTRDVRPPGFEL
jgi:hypothetical protein